MPRLSSRAGFTLIELLISISIIGVLITSAAISYQKVQQKGRDARRQSDLKVIQGSLQQYYADNSSYPATGSLITPLTTAPKNYLRAIPVDPVSGAIYPYVGLPSGCDPATATKCTTYCLSATLENTANAPAVECTSYSAPNNYAVAPP